MSWLISSITCLRCGYENAQKEEHNSGYTYNIICIRCGYSKSDLFDYGKYDHLLQDPEHKDDDHKKIIEQCSECKVIYPTGSYVYRKIGDYTFKIDSIEDGIIEKLLEHLHEYDVCKYTFYKVRSWYIKDLHSNTTALFSEDEYHRCTNGAVIILLSSKNNTID
jgi:hypothetical protein